MTREVYAEEIEEFLTRLEGVASARVVANEEGQIERIFLTTETERDDGGLRRTVAAALMSEYGLHLEGWRLHIAHLRPQPGRLPPARFRLFRIEETLTESTTRVLVDLRYEQDGTPKQAVGSAQSSPGAAFRLRTVAQATLEAMGNVLQGWKAALESVGIVPFAGVQVALVGITLAPPRGAVAEGPLVQVGGEVVRLSETEAVVKATLRALGQTAEEEEPRPRDRFGRMEEMRARYHRLIRVQEAPPPVPPGGPRETPAGGALEYPPVAEAPSKVAPPPAGSTAALPPAAPSPDVISGMQEIRPEAEGGAGMSTQPEPYRAEAARAGRGGLEDDFYRRLITSGVVVHIRCRDGYEIPEAVVKDFGTYSLLVDARGTEELIFKHAIISIRPRSALAHDVPLRA
jgi:sRNA-binding regulator protein Hfq